MSEIKALDSLRETLKSCVRKAGVEPDEFDTYWITASACDACIDEVEREISERYVLLPCDADGEPWTLETERFIDDTGRKVKFSGLQVDREGRWKILNVCVCHDPSLCRHVKPDPLKEILNEHLQEREKIVRKLESSMITLGEAENEEDACDKLFAERIRELMGGGAS